MSKVLLSVEESLRLCPPKYPNGVKFIKRVVLSREIVSYLENYNIREMHTYQAQANLVADSLSINGYIYSVSPPTIKVDPNNKDRFIGLTGYHRNAACDRLGWQTMIYDVLEFDSPLDERIHRTVSNQHRTPALTNTEMDIIKQIKEAIANNEIPNEDDKVKALISIMADDKTTRVQKNIFKKFRKMELAPGATLLSYHTAAGAYSTHEFAEKFNVPSVGTSRFEQTGKIGYLTGESTPKTSLIDGINKIVKMNKSDKLGLRDVEFYGWIKTPQSAPLLYGQREDFKKEFDEMVRNQCEFIHELVLKTSGSAPSVQSLVDNYPAKFKGFMAQNISSDPTKGGNPAEVGVVDMYGTPIVLPESSTEHPNVVEHKIKSALTHNLKIEKFFPADTGVAA